MLHYLKKVDSSAVSESAIFDLHAIDERTFEQIKNIEMAYEAWKKLEESFEGTKAIKSENAYILKENLLASR